MANILKFIIVNTLVHRENFCQAPAWKPAAVCILEFFSAAELGPAPVEQLQVPQQMLPLVPASLRKSSQRGMRQVNLQSFTPCYIQSASSPVGSDGSFAGGTLLPTIIPYSDNSYKMTEDTGGFYDTHTHVAFLKK